MKSLKAQLIAAIAMTLVAALTVGSSTYAWFTINSTVSASGMSVKATTSGSLLISKTNDSWTTASTSIDFSDQATTKLADIKPTSMNPNLQATTWWTAVGTDANQGAKPDTESYIELTGLQNDENYAWLYGKDGTYYALHETFYVQSATGSLEKLGLSDVSVTKLGTSHDDIEKAVCVRIEMKEVGSTAVTYTTWDNQGVTKSKYVSGAKATTDGYYLATDTSITEDLKIKKDASDTETHTVATVKEATSYQIDVYIYLDGENANCTAMKAYKWDGVSVTLDFAADVEYKS